MVRRTLWMRWNHFQGQIFFRITQLRIFYDAWRWFVGFKNIKWKYILWCAIDAIDFVIHFFYKRLFSFIFFCVNYFFTTFLFIYYLFICLFNNWFLRVIVLDWMCIFQNFNHLQLLWKLIVICFNLFYYLL